MKKTERKAIEEYLAERLEHNVEVFEKKFAFKRLLLHYQPQIVFDKTVMVTEFAEQLAQESYKVTKIIIYEATLMTELNFLSLILRYLEAD